MHESEFYAPGSAEVTLFGDAVADIPLGGRSVRPPTAPPQHRKYIFGARPAMILTAPAIYALIIPPVLLDLFVNRGVLVPHKARPGCARSAPALRQFCGLW